MKELPQREKLVKIFEIYRTGVYLEAGFRLKPMQIVENKDEIIINCSNLDHPIIFDRKLFKRHWEERA